MDTRPDHITAARACACGVINSKVLHSTVQLTTSKTYLLPQPPVRGATPLHQLVCCFLSPDSFPTLSQVHFSLLSCFPSPPSPIYYSPMTQPLFSVHNKVQQLRVLANNFFLSIANNFITINRLSKQFLTARS